MAVSLLAAAFFFFGRQIVSLYTNDLSVIEQGTRILKLVALISPFNRQFILGRSAGAGDAGYDGDHLCDGSSGTAGIGSTLDQCVPLGP